jgi:putative tryptophan/tyrosine transport system substrate-binding protein
LKIPPRRKLLYLAAGAAAPLLAGLGGTAVWPLAARAQQRERVRRVAVLMPGVVEDQNGWERYAAFREALEERGWREGRNMSIDIRWAAGDRAKARKYAAELVALAPDVIMGGGGLIVPALQEATGTVPIVFTNTIDPIALGRVAGLARSAANVADLPQQPGANTTGFLNMEFSFSAKWLELLKQIAPGVTRVGVLRDPGFRAQFAAIEEVATSLHVEPTPIDMLDAAQIERSMAAFAAEPDGGLIMTMSTRGTTHRELIVALAARHRLPAVYPARFDVLAGGLVSYGPVVLDQYRSAADYVDRILRGARPEDLPVQAPTKYELVLNMKTAKALGIEVPWTLLALADEVIE